MNEEPDSIKGKIREARSTTHGPSLHRPRAYLGIRLTLTLTLTHGFE